MKKLCIFKKIVYILKLKYLKALISLLFSFEVSSNSSHAKKTLVMYKIIKTVMIK